MLRTKTVDDFLEELASQSPAPGGGSVAALAAALGSALASMVCRLTLGKKKYFEVQAEMEEALVRSDTLRRQAAGLMDEDAEAFNQVMAAYCLSKDSDDQAVLRQAAIQQAVKEAIRIPLEVMRLAEESFQLVQTVAEKGNKNSASDAGVAALMLRAAMDGALLNVRTNLPAITDKEFASSVCREADDIKKRVNEVAEQTMAMVADRLS